MMNRSPTGQRGTGGGKKPKKERTEPKTQEKRERGPHARGRAEDRKGRVPKARRRDNTAIKINTGSPTTQIPAT
eukprot:7431921-Karenia_brevis.AAC.1